MIHADHAIVIAISSGLLGFVFGAFATFQALTSSKGKKK